MSKHNFWCLVMLMMFVSQASLAQGHCYLAGKSRTFVSKENLEYLFTYKHKDASYYKFRGDYVVKQDRNLVYLANGNVVDLRYEYKRLPNFEGKYLDLKMYCDWAVNFYPKAEKTYIEGYRVKKTNCGHLFRAVYSEGKVFRFWAESTQNCLICVDRNRERRDVWLLSVPVKIYKIRQ